MLPMGANSFLSVQVSFQKETGAQESKHKSCVSCQKMAKNVTSVSIHLKSWAQLFNASLA